MTERRDARDRTDEPDRKSPIFTEAQWAELTEKLSLSGRQEEIVRRLFRGMGDKQIAYDLGISINTVRTYMGRLFVRLDVEDRVELILRVMSQFLGACSTTNCPRTRGSLTQRS